MVLEIGHDTASLTPNALSRLVRTLGRADFGDTLLHTALGTLGAELVSAFTLDAEGQPHCCLARAVAGLGNELAEQAAQRYVAGYWHSDPGLAQLRQAQQASATTVLGQQGCDEIQHAHYRALCYEQPHLIDRLSVLAHVGNRRLLFNAYRRADRGPFSQPEVLHLATHGEVLLALIDRHMDLTGSDNTAPAPEGVHALAARLSCRFGLLSMREAQVCAGLILGMTAKEIARHCDIEPSSVVTYKKRAFGKLGTPNSRALVKQWSASQGRPMPASIGH